MIGVINDYIKTLRVKVILRHNILDEKPIGIYQVDFYGWDDKYHSICVGFNKARIFGLQAMNYIGNCNDVVLPIDNNHRVFDTKDEWLSGRYQEIKPRFLSVYAKQMVKAVTSDVAYNDFSAVKIDRIFEPVYCYILHYKYKDVQQNGLVLVQDQQIDCSTLYPECNDDFINFLSMCGLADLVSTNQIKDLGCFN